MSRRKKKTGKPQPYAVIRPDIGMKVMDAGIMQDQVLRNMSKTAYGNIIRAPIKNPYYTPELLKFYIQKLIDDGKMMKLSDVKRMDILDTIDFLPPPDNGYGMPSFGPASSQEREIMNKMGWYSNIPCFEKGAIRVNTFRYIVFEVLEIDPEKGSLRIRLRDYMKPDESIWQMGVGITAEIQKDWHAEDIKTNRFRNLVIEEKQNFEDLYTMYSAKELGWSERDYKQWLDNIIKNAELTTKQYVKQSGVDQCEHLLRTFILLIVRCNVMLEKNKPSKPVGRKTTKGERKTSYEKNHAPERKIRMVGSIRVQSKDVPKRPCLETVITYRTATWMVRGHVRHYKNGKEVYIKPRMHKRKALEGSDETTATTIRFKKKGNESI